MDLSRMSESLFGSDNRRPDLVSGLFNSDHLLVSPQTHKNTTVDHYHCGDSDYDPVHDVRLVLLLDGWRNEERGRPVAETRSE
jgi:hypothetical protein